MDYLEAVDGLLAFHRTEIERLEAARKVLLEIDGRAGERTPPAAKSAKAGKSKKRIAAKKANGHIAAEVPSRSTAKSKIVALLATDPDLTSGTIMSKIDMNDTPQAKQRVYTALHDLKKSGRVAVVKDKQYRLVGA